MLTQVLSDMRAFDIARRADVSPESVRYYTRLLFIRDARALGMSINDVQTVIKAADESRVSRPEIVALCHAPLGAVRQKIRALKRVERQ